VSEHVIVVNTHPGENPEFVGKLVEFLNSIGIEPEIVDGYENINPLDGNPSCIILTGVPVDANYSLAETDTQRKVNDAFGWLKECKRPVLGICYGHQILAQIFGGEVSSLKEMVKDERFPLAWKADKKSGLFSEVESLEVFAEHSDYVSEIPQDFKVLCQKDGIPYIMYRADREMYGVQFVPEQSDEKSKELLKRFVVRE
jgi:GMP synthase-like glutamine amidotransferase